MVARRRWKSYESSFCLFVLRLRTGNLNNLLGEGSGVSCGRLCPIPPASVRCSYLPENFFAITLGFGRAAFVSPAKVIVGTLITGPRRRAAFVQMPFGGNR